MIKRIVNQATHNNTADWLNQHNHTRSIIFGVSAILTIIGVLLNLVIVLATFSIGYHGGTVYYREVLWIPGVIGLICFWVMIWINEITR